MRKLINKLLAPLGYELRRVDRFYQYLDVLLAAPGGVRFVQIGANDGVRFDGLYGKVTQHRCAGLVVEPLPDIFERLRANYADYPQVVAVNTAIHATARSVDLYRVSPSAIHELPDWATGIASFDRGHLLRHRIPEQHIIAQAVECLSLMELLNRERFADANVLQVDTEGYDAEVIRMINFAEFKPQLIKYEQKNLSLPDRREIVQLLNSNGYRVTSAYEDVVARLA